MEVLNKGHPIRGWPKKAKTGVRPDRKPILGIRYIRALEGLQQQTMQRRAGRLSVGQQYELYLQKQCLHRLPRGEPAKSIDLEREWKTLISNYIVRTGEVRAGP
jgi:hypothetical protein